MSLLSDVPRSASVTAAEDSIIIETPRHALVKLMDAVPAVKHAVEQQWIPRALHMYLAPSLRIWSKITSRIV
jgi:CRP-like cAMP-binding protein